MMNKTNTYNNKILYFLDILEHYLHYLNYFTYTSSLSLISFDVFLNYNNFRTRGIQTHFWGFFSKDSEFIDTLLPFHDFCIVYRYNVYMFWGGGGGGKE